MAYKIFSKQWWNESLQLDESFPINFEEDDNYDYIQDQLGAINKAAAVFNVPIDDMEYAFNAGQDLVLGDDEWSKLENSNSYNIQTLGQVILYAKQHRIDIRPYLEAVKNAQPLPKPLVLSYGEDKYYLVAGELILSIYRALKQTPDVIQATFNLHINEELTTDLYSPAMQEAINSDINTWGMLPEYKMDLNDTYDYKKEDNFYTFYDDVNSADVIVKLKSLDKGMVEFKFYPIKDGNILGFDKLKSYNPKVINTVSKIFLNDILPNNDKVLIQPSDYTRYRLFRALINNHLPKNKYDVKTSDKPVSDSFILVSKKQINEIESEESNLVEEFIKYCKNKLQLNQTPKIEFSDDTDHVKEQCSFGYFDPNSKAIWVYVGDRNAADIFRTLAHELVHRKQDEDGRIKYESGKTGSDIENEANSMAGVILREFGKLSPSVYDTSIKKFIK
jgi:hypothetical protein